MTQKRLAQKLPRCEYPKAADLDRHGLYNLPEYLPSINWKGIEKYRSPEHLTVSLNNLTKAQILQMARMVAQSFAINEPMKRHLQPPRDMPETIISAVHHDPFGRESFGEWSAENLLFWFIRLFILTNPSDPIDAIGIKGDLNKLSTAILNRDSKIIGGAFNITVHLKEGSLRTSDPFLDAVLLADKPIFELIFSQEHEAIEALQEKYPIFRKSMENGEVGLHFMVARSPDLPTEHAFELVAASAETFQNQGFKFMVICASNQWTGAACEVMNGVRVHFAPFRTVQRVAKSENASPKDPFSEDGYIAKKDSGAMFYIVKLH